MCCAGGGGRGECGAIASSVAAVVSVFAVFDGVSLCWEEVRGAGAGRGGRRQTRVIVALMEERRPCRELQRSATFSS